ncbi:zinc ribbon domain-containing protein [Candidatus Agathobaculum pullicola]|uniref:zinc ribbon domain-containing protein n=1 Tax=Candidatus Agathobaculum pullicola TaxID=2838426 RepID=UPI003F937346
MKCQHCGINYNDEDRECPICGARTGTRGRVGELEKKAAAWREKQFADEPTYQKTRTRKAPVRAQKARASVKPIREAPKGKGKIAVVVIIAVILINILPALLPAARNLIDNFLADFSSFEINLGDGGAYEPDAEAEADDWVSYDDGAMYYERGQEYTYDSDNYISIYAALYDLIGEYAVATLADGTTLELQVEPGEMGDYTLRLNDGTGTYEEKGYTWCIYNYPEEGIYNDNFSPAQYDSLTLALSCNEWSYDGNLYERYDTRQENTDLWLVAYVDRETGQVTLQDAEQMGIFGTPALVPLTSVQTG